MKEFLIISLIFIIPNRVRRMSRVFTSKEEKELSLKEKMDELEFNAMGASVKAMSIIFSFIFALFFTVNLFFYVASAIYISSRGVIMLSALLISVLVKNNMNSIKNISDWIITGDSENMLKVAKEDNWAIFIDTWYITYCTVFIVTTW